MRTIFALFILATLVLASGCSDTPDRATAVSVGGSTNAVLYADLKDADVLVSVDGCQLTKADVERQVALAIALLKQKGILPSSQLDARAKLRLARRVRDQFVAQTLLTNAARRDKVEADEKALSLAWGEVAENYGPEGASNRVELILRRLKPDLRELLEENVKAGAQIYSYIDRKGGDAVKVTEGEIGEVAKQGAEMKQRSIAVLAEQREKALKLFGRLQRGEDFSKVAAESDTADEDEGVGSWGEFSLGQLEQLVPKLGPAVAKLGVGDYTSPIECDDAIYIVRLKAREGSGAPSTVNLAPELRTFERIVVNLPVMYEPGTREEIRTGIQAEKRADFQTKTLLPELRKDATIAYPSGTVQFTVKSKQKARKQ